MKKPFCYCTTVSRAMNFSSVLFTCCYLHLVVLAMVSLGVQDSEASKGAKDLMRVLFEEREYNPAIRPVLNNSEPVNVDVDLAIQQIINVDVKQEQITVLYWQRLHWFDNYLVWDPKDYEGLDKITIMPKHIWLPDIVVYNNVIQVKVEKDGVIPVSINASGYVKWDTPVIYVTTCTIHIKHFPYDAQVCTLKFGSWINTANEITIQNNRGHLDTAYFTINGEWMLGETPSVNNRVVYSDAAYTDVFIEMHLARRPLFYEKNLVTPTAMISLLASLTFMLPPESGEKIGLAITVFLALCVNLILVSEMMPATSLETPIIGQYYLMAISMVAVSLVMTVVVLNFHNPHPNALPPPRWILKLFSKYLAPLVFLSRVTKEDGLQQPKKAKAHLKNRRPSPRTHKTGGAGGENVDYITVDKEDHGHLSTFQDKNGQNSQVEMKVSCSEPREGHVDTHPALGALDDKISELIERLVGEDGDAQAAQEWQYVTRIIDRLLAVTFFSVTIFLTAYLIGKAKNVPINVTDETGNH
ncbi:neuronal acetylcholine receptor subunit beta-4-like isoform X2 [Symsagittifera roscoffensis]|uniref:neuronal acetylcholine receptor subunit beta-4-like isoform X2 n=1 Tax=Symsagittifera roscoffensis TaxID=84072 RepID=UPI00307C4604